ncbi:MAG TPA: PQQ-binding-like beta-propeller repeat protein [Actinomycetes bacterium]|nr:PQQ-binding-like beta-propeller repeat protein [Actinomycetes bacterium]
MSLTKMVAIGSLLAVVALPSIAEAGDSTDSEAAPEYFDATAFQISSKHDGRAPGSALPRDLTRLWTLRLKGDVSYPVIAQDLVFVTSTRNTSGTNVHAFDAQTGGKVWGPVDLGGPYGIGRLTYDAGRLFAINFDGKLQAFDASTGTPIWSRNLPGQYSFTAPPTADSGVVYVTGAGSGGTLYAVDEATGAVIWSRGVANGDESSPAVNSRSVFVSFACEVTYRFSLTGKSKWVHTTNCSGGGGRTAVLHRGKLWIRDDAGKTPKVLNTSDGERAGAFDSDTTPAFRNDTGFLMQNGTLTSIDAASRTVLWSQAGDGTLVSAPVISGRVAYVGAASGKVYGFDVFDGQLRWTGSVGAPVQTPDEHNAGQLQALAIGDGILAVPARHRLSVFG